MFSPGHSRILGVGTYAPACRISSREIMEQLDTENRFDIKHDWLERITGIKERRVSAHNELPSDLAAAAARDALEDAGLIPKDIDAIIYAGVVRDYKIEPSTAHIVQHKLGATNSFAFDVSNACLGIMSAVHVMDSLIATGQVRRGLIVTGEQGYRNTTNVFRALAHSHDRDLFIKLAAGLTVGDAGAAMVLAPKLDPDTGILGIVVKSEAEYWELCTCGKVDDDSHLETDMAQIVSVTVPLIGRAHRELLERTGWSNDDISLYCTHQVGIPPLRNHLREIGIGMEKVPTTVTTMGNIISATVPFALKLANTQRLLTDGKKIMLAGSGSGISVCQATMVHAA